jgi:hypothetical protein
MAYHEIGGRRYIGGWNNVYGDTYIQGVENAYIKGISGLDRYWWERNLVRFNSKIVLNI